jgi:hypothetical protein
MKLGRSRTKDIRRGNFQKDLSSMEPVGEDAPMTERLDRLTGRQAAKQQLPGDDRPNVPTGALPQDSSSKSFEPNSTRRGEQATMASSKTKPSAEPRASGSSPGTAGRSGQPQGLAVRTGGFQWIDRQVQPLMKEERSNASLMQTTNGTEKYGSSKSIAMPDQTQPRQSGSASRPQVKPGPS